MLRFALSALLVLVAACDSTADSDLPDDLAQDPAALVGTWDLAFVTPSGESSAPPVRTPASALPYTQTYVFGADGQAEVYSSGELSLSGPYEVRSFLITDGSGRISTDLYIDGDSQDWVGVSGDRLFFDSRPRDGALEEYHRR